jgi:hypothetical protein
MMRMRTASNYNKCISHAAAGHRDGPMTLVEFIHQIRMVAIYFDKIILGRLLQALPACLERGGLQMSRQWISVGRARLLR